MWYRSKMFFQVLMNCVLIGLGSPTYQQIRRTRDEKGLKKRYEAQHLRWIEEAENADLLCRLLQAIYTPPTQTSYTPYG